MGMERSGKTNDGQEIREEMRGGDKKEGERKDREPEKEVRTAAVLQEKSNAARQGPMRKSRLG
jgi:hypothetical protein